MSATIPARRLLLLAGVDAPTAKVRKAAPATDLAGEDYAEGRRAFTAKRRPVFKGC
jgi:hypothetical protein